jgi:hypothetical protein
MKPQFAFLLALPLLGFAVDEKLQHFESKIRPVLAEKCYECHSAKSGKTKGGLRLDHIEVILKGGDSGPALTVGDSTNSLLVEAIHYQDPDFHMPPKGKLSQDVISDLEKWINEGAVWPVEPVPSFSSKAERSSFNLAKRKKEHWSWQPITSPTIPVSESTQNLHPIDQLIREKLAHAGLLPSKSADKRTWLRRVTFDLTGLPPTLPEIENFLSDNSENSYQTVVARLLESPHYGEKWARHWMDLVRYAETCGHEFDYPLEHPHEYRDYLIRAFNLDVPYNQFLREHVAGDLIKEPRRHPSDKFNESIIGTGFWYFHEAVHAPTDSKVDNADRMENQLDVFGKTFLGLTIGCARCHDHKFDAISEKDYYSLAAFMQGSNRQDYPLDVGAKREEISGQLLSLAKEGFLSVERFQFNSGKPSDYWNVSSKLIEPKKIAQTDENPWSGEVLGDFENDFGVWKSVGKAFGTGPQTKTSGRNPVTNYHGKGWAGSLITGGDNLTGSLLSPEFIITKRFMNFLIAGGAIDNVGVELWIEESRKIISRGSNNENFMSKSWDLDGYLGKKAQIRLIDNATGGWGHIHADRFVQSDVPAAEIIDSPLPSEALITRISAEKKLSKDTLLSWCQHFGKRINLQTLSQRIKSARKSHIGLVNAEQNFIQHSKSFANFNSSKIPRGWKITGEAFKPRGHQLISFDGSTLFPDRNVLSSRVLGDRRVGNLRSPHFKIEHDQILVKAKAKKIFMRVVIDNYHMGKHSGLLFGGTVIKEANSDGDFKWFSLSPKKYKGHWAYLEFVDRGTDAYLEIDQVRFSNSGIGQMPDTKFAHILNNDEVNESNLPQYLDVFLENSFNRIDAGEFSTDEYSFFNYLYSEGLIPFKNQSGLNEIVRKAQAADSKTPRERYVLAMGEGSRFSGNVYVRGSPHNLGASVEGRNLTALGGQSGTRLDLAKQLISADNPLVSRVMANRIWLQFFGRGLVPTPDDFGPMGQEPSHPKLLDWLASDFRENNWSIKSLIREIVLSQTYRQSSTLNPANTQQKVTLADPQNILLHKMPIRRLQAEAIRDAILSFSGRIDKKLFGPSVPIYKTAFMTGRGGKKNGPLDGAGRRSIYGSVYRNFLSPFMLAFDQPAPFGTKGRRSVSNVPAQSLALLNDPFIIGQCKLMGRNTVNAQKTQTEALNTLYETITGKLPGSDVQQKLLSFLSTQSKAHGGMSEQVWSDLAHVLVNSKSFLFLN